MDVFASSIRSYQDVQNVFQAMATTLAMTAYFLPPHANISNYKGFDYIVVGSGSAGGIIATRLSEDPKVTVLLVEAGGDPPIESDIPSYSLYMKNSKVDWNYPSVPDKTLASLINKRVYLTRGKMLGGSSSINGMVYVRGSPADYNIWAEIVNDKSWNFDNILQYFKKSEDLQDETVLNSPTGIFHGTKGYIGVTRPQNNASLKYLDAFAEIGEDIVLDTSGKNPFGYTQPLVNVAHGARQSTARSFLGASKCRPNLYVAKYTLVIEIVFDRYKNAVGIKALKQNGEIVIIRARKEIIISAGAINSPQLLMLSGIGPKKHLEEKAIKVISDLPVGENLQDHTVTAHFYPTENAPPTKPTNPRDYSVVMAVGFVDMNKNKSQPDYQSSFSVGNAEGLISFCLIYLMFNTDICQTFYNESKGKEIMSVLVFSLHPKSRGRILLQSTNPLVYPLIDLGIYSDERDLEDATSYIEHFDRVSQSTYFKKFNSKMIVPPRCKGLREGSREYYKCQAQTMVNTGLHFAGTCAMGTVVDSRLRVYGVNRLRVADGSIMPTLTSGNINAPIMMIGEKAADMIKEDNAATK